MVQLKPFALTDGSNWKRKLEIGKVWTSLEMYLKALTRRKELKGCTSMSLQPSWKRKEKENAEKIPMIPEQQDLQEKEYQLSTSPNIT